MMLALRIRKAEVAVKDGRLDEAYQMAVREDVRDHRKGRQDELRPALCRFIHYDSTNPQNRAPQPLFGNRLWRLAPTQWA